MALSVQRGVGVANRVAGSASPLHSEPRFMAPGMGPKQSLAHSKAKLQSSSLSMNLKVAAGSMPSLVETLTAWGRPEEAAPAVITAPPGLEGHVSAAPPPATEEWPADATTTMIRHIACRFLKDDVIEVLNAMGFRGKYSTVHVPLSNKGRPSNLGYAFVDFKTAASAKECVAVFHGRTFGPSSTAKMCEVVPARLQGEPGEQRSKKAIQQAPRTPQSDSQAALQALQEPCLLQTSKSSFQILSF